MGLAELKLESIHFYTLIAKFFFSIFNIKRSNLLIFVKKNSHLGKLASKRRFLVGFRYIAWRPT